MPKRKTTRPTVEALQTLRAANPSKFIVEKNTRSPSIDVHGKSLCIPVCDSQSFQRLAGYAPDILQDMVLKATEQVGTPQHFITQHLRNRILRQMQVIKRELFALECARRFDPASYKKDKNDKTVYTSDNMLEQEFPELFRSLAMEDERQEENEPNNSTEASPAARKLAEENELDLSAIAGTGKDGLILVDDVRKALGSSE